jgi:hypothetical protein
MAVGLSTLRACSPLPPGRFLVPISEGGCVHLGDMMRLEVLGTLKIL